MSKQLSYGQQARKKLQAGVDKVAEAVKVTLGPRGRAVVIDRGFPTFTLDGVTVAEDITLRDPEENYGAELVKQAARKTNDLAGDGTTATTVLVQEILREGLKGVETGLDPTLIKAAVERGAKAVLEEVKKETKPVRTQAEMESVATISSRDPEIGGIIGQIFKKIGKDGIVSVEESRTVGLWHEFVEGMELDSGWTAPHFVTDPERQLAVIEDPYVLVTGQNLSSNQDIYNILLKISQSEKKSVVVIADDITGEALPTLILNKLKGLLKVVAVKAPAYGDNKKAVLQDIAEVVGAKIFSEETGTKVEEAEIEDLGRCERFVAFRNRSVIVGGKGDPKKIKARAKALEAQIKSEESDFKRQQLEKRHARISGGVAVIRTGSVTAAEHRERQYRIEDAVNATKSALDEGIVVGGGMALYRAAEVLREMIEKEKDISSRYGLEALYKAVRRPAQQIIENRGENAAVILMQTGEDQSFEGQGYNAATGKFCDLLKEGVVDPAKVVRVALENAVSTAGLFLITEAVSSSEPEKKKTSEE